MKQSNHALTFLLAHYRAICERAWRAVSTWGAIGVATVALATSSAANPLALQEHRSAAQPQAETVPSAAPDIYMNARRKPASFSLRDECEPDQTAANYDISLTEAGRALLAAEANSQGLSALKGRVVSAVGKRKPISFSLWERHDVQVDPDTPVVHVPNFMAPRAQKGEHSVFANFFDLAEDGSALCHHRELSGNRLTKEQLSASVFAPWEVAPLASDAAATQGASSVNDNDNDKVLLKETESADQVRAELMPRQDTIAVSDNKVAAAPCVELSLDGAITLTDVTGATMELRPNDAHNHQAAILIGSYQLKLQPDIPVELSAGSSLVLDGTTRAISVEDNGALSLDWAALSAYDLTLSEGVASNLLVDVSALGEMELPSLVKLSGEVLAAAPAWDNPAFAPQPEVSAARHDDQFPISDIDGDISDKLSSNDEAKLPSLQAEPLELPDKLSLTSNLFSSHGLTMDEPQKTQQATSMPKSLFVPNEALMLSSTKRVGSSNLGTVLDLGSLNSLPQGWDDRFAVDLVLKSGSTLVLTDHKPTSTESLGLTTADNSWLSYDTRDGSSVFDVIAYQPRRIDLAYGEQNLEQDALALTYRASWDIPKVATKLEEANTVKFVLASNTPVLLDVSALELGALAITPNSGEQEVVLSRDESTGLLAINGADIALPVTGSGRVSVTDLLAASNEGIAENQADLVDSAASAATSHTVLDGISSGDHIAGSWQALETDAGSDKVVVSAGESLSLNGTLSSGGLTQDGASEQKPNAASGVEPDLAPLAASSSGKIVGIELGAGSALNINSAGKIGSLTGKGTVNLNGVELMVVSHDSDRTDDVKVKAVKLKDSKLKARDLKTKDFDSLSSTVQVESLKVSDDGSFSAEDSELKLQLLDVSKVQGKADISSSKVDTAHLLARDMSVQHGSSVYARQIKLSGAASVLAVGHDDTELKESKPPLKSALNKKPPRNEEEHLIAPWSYFQTVTSIEAESIDLNGGLLWLNAPEGERATVTAPNFGPNDGAKTRLSGNVVVGHNSALGITSNLAAFAAAQEQAMGEGEADGKNAGQGIKNDLNFYSLGLFLGLDLGNKVKAVADVSYARMENDLSAHTGVTDWNLMSSSTDSSNLNVGLGIQTTVTAAESALEVSPHLVLRYQMVDIDDYDVLVDGTKVAANSIERMHMLSVPFGVSIARNFVSDQWLVRPAVDLTLSANMGDADMYSSTGFVGITGANFNYCTQVIDDFSYSLSTGVAVKYDSSFSALVNCGYNGSLHADDYMVNAQLHYLF